MRKQLLLSFLLLSLVFAAKGDITYKICSGKKAIGTIRKIDIDPNPTAINVETFINATTVLNKDVTFGSKWKLRVSYNKVPVYWKNGDFCEDSTIDLPYSAGYLSVKGLNCPQPAGEVIIQEAAKFVRNPPSGIYTFHIELADEKKKEIATVEIYIEM